MVTTSNPCSPALQNAAVDASNRGLVSSSKKAAVQVAWLRHIACELLHAVPTGLLQEFQQLQLINFCLRVSFSKQNCHMVATAQWFLFVLAGRQ